MTHSKGLYYSFAPELPNDDEASAIAAPVTLTS